MKQFLYHLNFSEMITMVFAVSDNSSVVIHNIVIVTTGDSYVLSLQMQIIENIKTL